MHHFDVNSGGWGLGQYSLAWSPDGSLLAATSSPGDLIVWDTNTGDTRFRRRGHTSAASAVAWSGNRLATAGEDRRVKIWDPVTGDELLALIGHVGPVFSVAWSPDGRRLASAGQFTVKIWEAPGFYPDRNRNSEEDLEEIEEGQ